MQVVQNEPEVDVAEAPSATPEVRPQVEPPKLPVRPAWRLWRRIGSGIAVVLVALTVALPTIISNTSISHAFLNYPLDDGTTATAESFQIGWFSPLVATGVEIQKAGQDEPVKVEKLEVQKSLLDILRNKIKDATITLTKPKFRIVMGDNGKSAGALFPKMKTKVVDGTVTIFELGSKEPLFELPNLNFTSDVKTVGNGRQMSITSATIIDHYKLTPEFTDHGLGLVAPLLANAADIDGSLSLRIDSLKVHRIDNKSTIKELRGSVTLHDVTSTAGPVVADLLDILGYMMRRDLPEQLSLTKESVVNFHMQDERIYHEGFAFVLPEVASNIQLHSAGSVGLDESLDLKLSLIVPESLAVAVPILGPFVGKPVEISVTGTIAEPVVGLPENQDIANYIASRLVPTADGQPEALPAAIFRLVSGVASPSAAAQERVQTLPGGIMNLIRSVKENRQKRIDAGEVVPQRRQPPRRRRGRRNRRPE